jgi:hypothetical protein
VGNLLSCSPQFLRESFDEVSVSAVAAAAELKTIRNVRLESPHGDPVLQAAYHERMDQRHAEACGHKFARRQGPVGQKNDLVPDPMRVAHIVNQFTDIDVHRQRR